MEEPAFHLRRWEFEQEIGEQLTDEEWNRVVEGLGDVGFQQVIEIAEEIHDAIKWKLKNNKER